MLKVTPGARKAMMVPACPHTAIVMVRTDAGIARIMAIHVCGVHPKYFSRRISRAPYRRRDRQRSNLSLDVGPQISSAEDRKLMHQYNNE